MKESQINASKFFKAENEYTKGQKYFNLILSIPLIIQGVAQYYNDIEDVFSYTQVGIAVIGYLLSNMALQSLNNEGRGVLLKLFPITRADAYKNMLKFQYIAYLGTFVAFIASYALSGLNTKALAMALELNGITLSMIAAGGVLGNMTQFVQNTSLKLKITVAGVLAIFAFFGFSLSYIFSTLDGGVKNIVIGVALNALFPVLLFIDLQLNKKSR